MNDIDTAVVLQIITAVLFSGGAGYAASKLIDYVPKLSLLPFGRKRIASWGISMGISWVVYGLAVWLGFYSAPETAQALVTTMITLGSLAVTTNQTRHGREKIRELNGS